MSERMKIAIIGAGARAMEGYCKHFLQVDPPPRFVAIAEPSEVFLDRAMDELGLDRDEVRTYGAWEELLDGERDLDAAVIGTPNHLHHGPAVTLLERGVPLVLEKPMAVSDEECYDIHRLAVSGNILVQLGFVLRSAPFYLKVRELLDQDAVGQILSLEADEFVGPFVTSMMFRGGWRRHRRSSGGALLEKCCHDMDLLNWMADARPTMINSVAGRRLFTPSPAVGHRCPECPVQDECLYAQDIGNDVDKHERKMRDYLTQADACIYNVDSDLYDHQSVQIVYENGVVANFLLTFNTPGPRAGRNIHIVGTEGRIWGNMSECAVYHHDNKTDRTEEHPIVMDGSGHGGGDRSHAEAFLHSVMNGTGAAVANTWDGYLSAAMCFAADRSVAEARRVHLRYSADDQIELV